MKNKPLKVSEITLIVHINELPINTGDDPIAGCDNCERIVPPQWPYFSSAPTTADGWYIQYETNHPSSTCLCES